MFPEKFRIENNLASFSTDTISFAKCKSLHDPFISSIEKLNENGLNLKDVKQSFLDFFNKIVKFFNKIFSKLFFCYNKKPKKEESIKEKFEIKQVENSNYFLKFFYEKKPFCTFCTTSMYESCILAIITYDYLPENEDNQLELIEEVLNEFKKSKFQSCIINPHYEKGVDLSCFSIEKTKLFKNLIVSKRVK